MPGFLHVSSHSMLITSFKVMYSTLREQPKLTETIPRLDSIFFKWVAVNQQPYFLSVRNPYTRIESFFKDKFRKSVILSEEKNEWQDFQKRFFAHLGLRTTMLPKTVGHKLRSTSLAEMLSILPEVYTSDPHIWPQHWHKTILGVSIPMKFDRVFKMECPDDLSEIATTFDLNFSISANSTQSVKETLVWTEEHIEMVKHIYREDFKRFGYSLDIGRKKEGS